MRLRTGVLERLRPGSTRQAESEAHAARFLEGMESPPRSARGRPQAHW